MVHLHVKVNSQHSTGTCLLNLYQVNFPICTKNTRGGTSLVYVVTFLPFIVVSRGHWSITQMMSLGISECKTLSASVEPRTKWSVQRKTSQ